MSDLDPLVQEKCRCRDYILSYGQTTKCKYCISKNRELQAEAVNIAVDFENMLLCELKLCENSFTSFFMLTTAFETPLKIPFPLGLSQCPLPYSCWLHLSNLPILD